MCAFPALLDLDLYWTYAFQSVEMELYLELKVATMETQIIMMDAQALALLNQAMNVLEHLQFVPFYSVEIAKFHLLLESNVMMVVQLVETDAVLLVKSNLDFVALDSHRFVFLVVVILVPVHLSYHL